LLFEIGMAILSATFELNDLPMSAFKLGATSLPAFSGLGEFANKRAKACVRGLGPIPPGRYYIIDRQSGGLLGSIRDFFTGREDWFALYAADGLINDETFCNGLKRGNFRLHPKGILGRSEGCITIDKLADFFRLRAILKSARPTAMPRSALKSYGMLVVK
jgi:Protein of unknown function (DUF2778)